MSEPFTFETLVGKALSDENFAAALVKDPEATLREAGIEPTPEILEVLKGVDVAGISCHRRRAPVGSGSPALTSRPTPQRRNPCRSRGSEWRKEGDSNPRRLAPRRFSRPLHSSALPSFRRPS